LGDGVYGYVHPGLYFKLLSGRSHYNRRFSLMIFTGGGQDIHGQVDHPRPCFATHLDQVIPARIGELQIETIVKRRPAATA
jgi:hypothetical protein